MKLSAYREEDFTNYKKASLFLGTTKCSFKCELECGKKMCQNSSLALAPVKDRSDEYIVNRYINNPITKGIVFGGLEPFDTFADTLSLINAFRKVTNDDIVIYTGFNKDEIDTYIKMLSIYPNIIIKYGRYIPDEKPHLDEILGVELASNNQYAEKIS